MYVIWQKPDGVIYYKYVKCTYKNYYLGYKNNYDHTVICTIRPNNYSYRKHSFSFKRALRRCLRWLYNKI